MLQQQLGDIHINRIIEWDDPILIPMLFSHRPPRRIGSRKAKLIANDYALDDNVWLEPTPGHTPDHIPGI